jgi:hypothetical protein
VVSFGDCPGDSVKKFFPVEGVGHLAKVQVGNGHFAPTCSDFEEEEYAFEYTFILAGWRQLFQGGNEIFFRNFVCEADQGLKQRPISWTGSNSSSSLLVFPFSPTKVSQQYHEVS